MLSTGRNDFIPKYITVSNETICKFVLQNSDFRNMVFVFQDERYYLNKQVFVDLIKHVNTPKRLRGSNISYEDVRALNIAKKEH